MAAQCRLNFEKEFFKQIVTRFFNQSSQNLTYPIMFKFDYMPLFLGAREIHVA